MSRSQPTYIGEVDSVNGSIVGIKLRDDLASTLILIGGESYRIGQIGAFLRIPLGYTQLYGVCTKVGASAISEEMDFFSKLQVNSNRSLSIILFGEAIGNYFERGVSQYPTIGDEVHLVTNKDLEVIYDSRESNATITLGRLAASSSISGNLDLGKMISKHCAIVGSTGSGKSNLVGVLLESIAEQKFSNARILVIDPHGEYGSCIGKNGYTFKINPDIQKNERMLEIPFWALPFDELKEIMLGNMQQGNEAFIRDKILGMKKEVSKKLSPSPPDTEITADSPIPFDLYQLWFDLDCRERQTYQDSDGKTPEDPIKKGNAHSLTHNEYPTCNPGSKAPFAAKPRGIQKNLEMMRSKLKDDNYRFLFSLESKYFLDAHGNPQLDIDSLVASWVGHDRLITVLDVSGLPSETTSAIVGTLLRIVYDTLFWAGNLPIGGKQQPLLVVLEEAHLFLPDGEDSSAHRTIKKIAKEGRKYGVGLVIVTQRPTEIDSTALSQCGTMISLRLTNGKDRAVVASSMPDDLGDLITMLPSLRTGEGLVIGEAMPIPSRIQFRKAINKPIGDSPDVGNAWRKEKENNVSLYTKALNNWRSRSFNHLEDKGETNNG
jgi:hypothetical protein